MVNEKEPNELSKREQEHEQKKRYNLKNDVIFQTFFSRKGNEEFLIDFLSALLKRNIKTIKIREEVNLEKLSLEEKGGRLDLQANLEDGTIVSIEMQLRNEYNIEERTTAFIDDYNQEVIKVAEEKNDKLKKARIEMDYLTGDAEVRRLAELREKWEMDRVSAINYATRNRNKRRKN